MLIVTIIVISIVAIIIAEKKKRKQQEMMMEHRMSLLKVVDDYKNNEHDIFGWFFSEDDRELFREAVKRGNYDKCTEKELEESMYQLEYDNWCAR